MTRHSLTLLWPFMTLKTKVYSIFARKSGSELILTMKSFEASISRLLIARMS